MTPRLRRHTDGRVALSLVADRWKCFDSSSTAIPWSAKHEHVSGPGWSELLVAVLPEPDGHFKTGEPYWNAFDGLPEFVARSDSRIETMHGAVESPVGIRLSALKMLAAVAACEQYREATT